MHGYIDTCSHDLSNSWSCAISSHPCCFTPGERAPCTHWIGGWVDQKASPEDIEKLKFLTLQDSNSTPSVIQPIACLCTDYATAHSLCTDYATMALEGCQVKNTTALGIKPMMFRFAAWCLNQSILPRVPETNYVNKNIIYLYRGLK